MPLPRTLALHNESLLQLVQPLAPAHTVQALAHMLAPVHSLPLAHMLVLALSLAHMLALALPLAHTVLAHTVLVLVHTVLAQLLQLVSVLQLPFLFVSVNV